MKIAFFEIKGWEKNFLKKRLKDHVLTFYHESLNLKNVQEIKNVELITYCIQSSSHPSDKRDLNTILPVKNTGFLLLATFYKIIPKIYRVVVRYTKLYIILKRFEYTNLLVNFIGD